MRIIPLVLGALGIMSTVQMISQDTTSVLIGFFLCGTYGWFYSRMIGEE